MWILSSEDISDVLYVSFKSHLTVFLKLTLPHIVFLVGRNILHYFPSVTEDIRSAVLSKTLPK